MNPLIKAALDEKARLHRLDDETRGKVARIYQTVADRLQGDLEELQELIADATERGETVDTGWLHREARARKLVVDLDRHLRAAAGDAATVVSAGQSAALALAVEAAPRLTIAAIGRGPRNGDAIIRGSFNQMNTAALEKMIGRARDGKNLADVLTESTPATIRKVNDTLAYGVAAGKNPRHIGAEVAKIADVPRHRGELIARQEVIGSYRDASSEAFEASPVVNSWVWRSAQDTRTCALCWSMDGQEFPDDESMESHLACRCVQIPRTASWEELGFKDMPDSRPPLGPSGPEAFDQLPDLDKRKILGPTKYDAYQRGDITLADLKMSTHSKRWGSGIRQATTGEAMKNAERRRAAEGGGPGVPRRPRNTADENGPLGHAIDPDGRHVELWPSDWDHIQEKRGRDFTPADVLKTVRDPHLRREGRTTGTELYFREGLGPSNWLTVVVDNNGPSIVWTAHPQRTRPKT